MKYLFICAIGPVQDFIATARRSRDLWYGSWMLSELSKAAAQKILELAPNSLIFPDPESFKQEGPDKRVNVPNKIVAILEADPETFKEEVGNKVKKAIITRLGELRDDAFSHVAGNFNRSLAEKQIADLPEFYWVAVPCETEEKYPGARNQAEALLAARKTTRDFLQAVGTNAAKSSLDGARESVIHQNEYPGKFETEDVKKEKIINLYRHYHARQGEQLSGVDILKRLGESEAAPKFHSTSHIAALPFMQKWGKEITDKMITEIRKLFIDQNWNIGEHEGGALLYESRLTDWVQAGSDQEALRKQLSMILQKYVGESRPSPYYALLAADGDNMGVVIDAQKGSATHRNLSHALSEFAKEVHTIVEKYQGVTVYAGGDDVLAYLPLHTALNCARELENTFSKKLEVFKAQKDDKDISPTLSTGIVVAHHLEPLSDVLELARAAEKEAKKVDGKNGMAITVSKRSGADRTISGKYKDLNDRIQRLISFARQDAISAGTAYELQELHRVLSGTGIPPEGIIREALRIVGRKQESGGGQKVSSAVVEAFKDWLEVDGIEVDELTTEMIVARMFSGSEIPAEPLKQEKEKVLA